jgi:hypothetical protein
MKIEELVGSL